VNWLRAIYYRWLGVLPPPAPGTIITNWGLRCGRPFNIQGE
jgi:hypothetical protein